MKKVIIVLACLVLALGVFVLNIMPGDGGTVEKSSVAHGDAALPEGTLSRREARGSSARSQAHMPWNTKHGGSGGENLAWRRQLEAAKVEYAPLPSPPAMVFFSATVDAEIAPGESLVTGGYSVGEGVFEFTFITPRKIVLDDGREVVEMKMCIIEATSDFIAETGMESLTTGEQDTEQHAEAWQQEDVAATQIEAAGHERVGLSSAPSVITLPGKEAVVEIVNDHGAGYALQATVSMTREGGFAIQSRVQRSKLVEPEPYVESQE